MIDLKIRKQKHMRIQEDIQCRPQDPEWPIYPSSLPPKNGRSIREFFYRFEFFFTDIPRPTGGGGYFEPPLSFLAISSKPMQVSPPNLQYPLY